MNVRALINTLVKECSLKYYVYNDHAYGHLSHSVLLKIQYLDREFESWGVSNDHDLAFFKALMELVERVSLANSCSLYYKKFGFWNKAKSLIGIGCDYSIPISLLYPDNSNGTGVGISKRMAKKSAFFELIERHTILSALYLNVSPIRCIDPPIDSAILNKHNVRFYYWKLKKFYVVVAVHFQSNGGYQFAHSCSLTINDAIEKSFNELTPNIIFSEKRPELSHSINRVIENDIKSFNLYWRFSGDQRVLDFLERPLVDESEFEKIPLLRNIYFGEICIPEIFKSIDYPLRCFKAISPEAQQLFFDDWKLKYINPQLICQGSLPQFPHFIS